MNEREDDDIFARLFSMFAAKIPELETLRQKLFEKIPELENLRQKLFDTAKIDTDIPGMIDINNKNIEVGVVEFSLNENSVQKRVFIRNKDKTMIVSGLLDGEKREKTHLKYIFYKVDADLRP